MYVSLPIGTHLVRNRIDERLTVGQRLFQLIGTCFHGCLQSSVGIVRSKRNRRKSGKQGNMRRARRRNGSAVGQVDGARESTLNEKWRNNDRLGNPRGFEEWLPLKQLVMDGFPRIGSVDGSFGNSYVQQ